MILSRHIIDLVGWTLIHFLWQGAAVAALYALAVRAIPRRSANARYLLACAALLLLTCCPVVTFCVLSHGVDEPSRGVSRTIDFEAAVYRGPAVVQAVRLTRRPFTVRVDAIPTPDWQTGRDRLDSELPWLVVGWLVGVLILSIRLLFGWIEVGRIRKKARCLPDHPLRKTLADLAIRLGVRRPVEIAESDRVDVPAMIGWLKPLALIPVGAMLWMCPEELEALIAHELAHVRRCDYLVNLAQSLIETVLFYHPAVWWISGRIRSEREACCDDMAVAAVGNPVVYARALAALAEVTSPLPALAMAASGGSAIKRIRRVLGKPEHGREPLSGWIAGALAATILLAAALPIHQRSNRRRPAATRTVAQKAPGAVLYQRHSAVMQPRSIPGAPVIQVLAPSSSLRKEPSMPFSSPRTRAVTWPALAPLVLSLASSASSPALASPHPAPGSPAHRTTAPAQSTTPAQSTAMVREMIPLKYIDSRIVVQQLEDSLTPAPAMPLLPLPSYPLQRPTPGTSKATVDSRPAPLPPTLLRIFPTGTQLIPFAPKNALIAISSPDGVALLKQMLKPIDIMPRFILFRMAEVVAPLKELSSAGIRYDLSTPLTSNGLCFLGGNFPVTLKKRLEARPEDHILGRHQIIVPANECGMVEEVAISPVDPEAGNGSLPKPPTFSHIVGLLGRLNSDGTISVYARIEDKASSRKPGSEATAGTTTEPLPGIRLTNGDTIGLFMRLPSPGQLSRNAAAPASSPKIPSPGRTNGSAPEEHTGDENCVVYFITPNLVDDHGQIVPGGADAVRKAWQEDHPE